MLKTLKKHPKYSEFANPTFKTKDEYLTWRAEWREEYANLSNDIRQLKQGIKALRKEGWATLIETTRPMKSAVAVEMIKGVDAKDTPYLDLPFLLQHRRDIARKFMAGRVKSKELCRASMVAAGLKPKMPMPRPASPKPAIRRWTPEEIAAARFASNKTPA